MRKLLLATLLVLAWLSPCLAQQSVPQPHTYTFVVSADDATRIMNRMSELPWKDVNALMLNLINQINTQNASAPAAPASPKE